MNNFDRIKTLSIDVYPWPTRGTKLENVSRLISWSPPLVGYFKLNIDDSVLGNLGQASTEGIGLNQGC